MFEIEKESTLTAMEQLHGFIDNLYQSLDIEVDPIECDNIVLCGMGGSAISGNIITDAFYTKSKKYIHTLRSPIIPKWMNEKSLAVISSYSGNTMETLGMYDCAKKQNCKIITITSGGILEKKALENNDPILMMPKGLDPRHSIGYMVGYIISIIKSTSGADITKDIKQIIPYLKKYRDVLESNDESNPAIMLAEFLMDKTAIMLYDDRMESVALRWKSQISENAKYVAFSKPLTDFRHPAMLDTYKHNNFHPIIITNTNADENQMTFAKKAIKTLDENNIQYNIIEFSGYSDICNIMEAIMLGDYMSIYMANMRNVNPRDVWPIVKLKKKLEDKMKNTK